MTGIWAIVLAAGESRRMGSPKMILPYEGKTIIERVLDNILVSDVDQVVTILGCYREEILKITGNYPVKHFYNSNYKEGMFTSVQCGFRFLPDDFRAVILFLGDQPMAETAVINRLINAFGESDKGIAIPVFDNKRGHPLLVSSKYRNEIITLDEPDGMRGFLRNHPDDILEVETVNPSILKDIDTREEYLREISEHDLHSNPTGSST
ncbi:MAG: nucleotidyltransferase family protein [Bacteroidales bacterium]|nr:nucleotidyltransferase family protein [Bacteroidales bacterium]